MKHKILKVLLILLFLSVGIAACLYHGIYISVESLNINYETIHSNKIPEELDNVSIGYISDLYYGEFMNKQRLEMMIEKIENTKVDILLFGGDLFANPNDETIDGETINYLTDIFSKLEAPLGKFYILGDIDCSSEDSKTLVSNILYNAGFEYMGNKNLKIHNGSFENFTLIGLDNMLNSTIDVESAFASTSDKSFNLLFTHTPDIATSLSYDSIDLIAAGHSLGGQNRIPFIGSLNKIEGAEVFSYNTYNVNNTIIHVSNGLGTTKADMRLFCIPEFPVFVLRSN